MSTTPNDKPADAAPTAAPADSAASLPPISPPPAPVPLPPAPPAAPPVLTRPPTDARAKLFLALTALALACWFAWLGYAALNKSRAPIVSRAQASVTPVPVRATVTADANGAPKGLVTVVEVLKPVKGVDKGAALVVTNLPTARGFVGEGEYLLLLAPDSLGIVPENELVYELVALRATAADTDPPVIYRWSADVEAQAKKLFATK